MSNKNKEIDEVIVEKQVKNNNLKKLINGLLIAGGFASGFVVSTIVNEPDAEPVASVDIRAEGIGQEFKDLKLGMSLEEVEEVVDLEKENIASDKIEDQGSDALVLSVDTLLGDTETHRDYAVVMDGELERIYEFISVQPEDVTPVVDQLLEEVTEENGQYDFSSSFYVDDEYGSGYITEYTWEEEDFSRSIVVSPERDGLVNIINDTYLVEPLDVESGEGEQVEGETHDSE